MCTISIIPFREKKMSIERVEKICLEFLRSEANLVGARKHSL